MGTAPSNSLGRTLLVVFLTLAAGVASVIAPWGLYLLLGLTLVLAVMAIRASRHADGAGPPTATPVVVPAPQSAPAFPASQWLAALPMPAVLFDGEGVVREANESAVTFFGVGDASKRSVESLFTHAEAIDCVRAAIAVGSQERGGLRQTFLRVSRGGSPRVYRVQACALGGGALVLLSDETAAQTAEALKTDFVAAASHELRTPLASIKAALETLESGALASPTMADRFLRMIRDNAERLEDLTADLMDLSRLQRGREALRFSTVSSEALIAYLRPLYEPRIEERGLTLECVVEPGAEQLRTDERLLKLVLRNLVDNAVKFTERDTTITLRVAPTPAGVRWSVRDQGPGIPLAEQPKIFERFYQIESSRRGDSRQRGTGLGLAIAKEAIDALGASIAVESVWGQGATMIVDVPRGNAPAE